MRESTGLSERLVRTFILFTIWTHPLQMREYPLRYAGTDRIKKSHYNLNDIDITSFEQHKFHIQS